MPLIIFIQTLIIRGYGDTTGKLTIWLVNPASAAVMLVFPTAIPVTKPAEEIVAMVVSELAQVT